MYRWVDDRGQRGRRILVDPEFPECYWGIVDDMGDGEWFVTFPAVADPRMLSAEAAELTVECAQGIEPSEVER